MIDNTSALEFNYSIQDRLIEVCEPLRDYLGIDHFAYGMFMEDDKALFLSTHNDVIKYNLIDNKNGNLFNENIMNTSKKTFFLWPELPQGDHILEYTYNLTNLWHGLTIHNRRSNFIESFNFMPRKGKGFSNDFYLKTMNSIEHFMIYFKDKTHDLINPLDPKKLAYFKCDIDFKGDTENQGEKFLQATPIKKYYAECYGEELYLTPQEFECLKYYAQGRTMKEIARFKGIVPRTVEAHIDKIKKKTGYNFKNELAKFFEANFGF